MRRLINRIYSLRIVGNISCFAEDNRKFNRKCIVVYHQVFRFFNTKNFWKLANLLHLIQLAKNILSDIKSWSPL